MVFYQTANCEDADLVKLPTVTIQSVEGGHDERKKMTGRMDLSSLFLTGRTCPTNHRTVILSLANQSGDPGLSKTVMLDVSGLSVFSLIMATLH